MFKWIVLIVPVSILFLSCAGPEGPTGPAGADGNDGVANIKTINISVYPSDWTVLDSNFVVTYVDIPEITQSIKDSGAVLIYLVFSSGNQIQLPTTWISGGNNDALTVNDFIVRTGQVEIAYTLANIGEENYYYTQWWINTNWTTINYKVVIIPPAVFSGRVIESFEEPDPILLPSELSFLSGEKIQK